MRSREGSQAGEWREESSLAESALGFCLAGQSKQCGLSEGEDEGKLQLGMKGKLEAERPARSGYRFQK